MVKKPTELYDSAYHNSLKSEGVKSIDMPPKKRINLKPAIIVLAAAALITGTVAVYNRIDYMNDQKKVNEFYTENGYYSTIQSTSWDKIGEKGYKYGFNQNNLADWVNESENPDLTLFSIYKGIKQNTQWNMNEVLSKVRLGQDGSVRYENFKDYLTQKGFVDKEGNPDVEQYEKVMTERVLAEKVINEVEQNNGISK